MGLALGFGESSVAAEVPLTQRNLPMVTASLPTIEDYKNDIERFCESPDEAVIAKIVKYCGIALRKADSATVASSDRAELNRVRDGFAKKKLGLDQVEAADGVKLVCAAMKGVRRKKRVTFYYLLADATGTLSKLA